MADMIHVAPERDGHPGREHARRRAFVLPFALGGASALLFAGGALTAFGLLSGGSAAAAQPGGSLAAGLCTDGSTGGAGGGAGAGANGSVGGGTGGGGGAGGGTTIGLGGSVGTGGTGGAGTNGSGSGGTGVHGGVGLGGLNGGLGGAGSVGGTVGGTTSGSSTAGAKGSDVVGVNLMGGSPIWLDLTGSATGVLGTRTGTGLDPAVGQLDDQLLTPTVKDLTSGLVQ